ncbi:MAG: DUF4307 domain-containing protein [Corynebacterium sp.]|nr:DUF4307 domain-containing protein [Corynebacterium sp.]
MSGVPNSTKSTNPRRSARYGERIDHSRSRSGDLTAKALIAVFVAIIGVSVFFGYQFIQSQRAINAKISYIAHQEIDEETLGVWVDVTRNKPNEPAYCIVNAYDYAKAEVGRREFVLAADGRQSIRIFVPIPTSAPAVAGDAYGCSSTIPDYLDVEHTIYE